MAFKLSTPPTFPFLLLSFFVVLDVQSLQESLRENLESKHVAAAASLAAAAEAGVKSHFARLTNNSSALRATAAFNFRSMNGSLVSHKLGFQ